MPFNSYEFILILLPASALGYWLLARFATGTAALAWLLLASVVFYASDSALGLLIIVPSLFFDYAIARFMLRVPYSKTRIRGLLLTVGIAANVIFLCYFKYKNFFLDTANILFSTKFELHRLVLPLGISFLTFQKIAFLADVQSGRIKSIWILDYLVFLLFFPRTLAGPIVRYDEVVPQLLKVGTRNIPKDIAVGVGIFAIGLFKKTIIADGIANYVPLAFSATMPSPAEPGLIEAWVGVLAYTFQLYFDFSGYSDMAIGAARIFGIRLPMNFNSPFKACSVVAFWSRWHMTLTRFLTAYLYTPIMLQLTRRRLSSQSVYPKLRSNIVETLSLIGPPTVATMVIAGLWHGAGWQYVVFGLLHGLYLTINQTWRVIRRRFWLNQASYERWMKPVGFVLTFTAVVIAFVFFRAPSVTSAVSLLASMLGLNGILPQNLQVLQEMGVTLPWTALWTVVAPLKWIVVLFLFTTLLPNSLELFRRYDPALDFANFGPGLAQAQSASPQTNQKSVGAWIRNTVATIRDGGVEIDSRTAVVTALLSILGILTLNRTSTFIYWQF